MVTSAARDEWEYKNLHPDGTIMWHLGISGEHEGPQYFIFINLFDMETLSKKSNITEKFILFVEIMKLSYILDSLSM